MLFYEKFLVGFNMRYFSKIFVLFKFRRIGSFVLDYKSGQVFNLF